MSDAEYRKNQPPARRRQPSDAPAASSPPPPQRRRVGPAAPAPQDRLLLDAPAGAGAALLRGNAPPPQDPGAALFSVAITGPSAAAPPPAAAAAAAPPEAQRPAPAAAAAAEAQGAQGAAARGLWRLKEQPNEVQRKSYKSENRFILPNPLVLLFLGDQSFAVDGEADVRLAAADGTPLGEAWQRALDGAKTARVDEQNQIAFSLILREKTSEGRVCLLFRVRFRLRGDTETRVETLATTPFRVDSNRKKNAIERPVLTTMRPQEGPSDAATTVWVWGSHFTDAVNMRARFGAMTTLVSKSEAEVVECSAPQRPDLTADETVAVWLGNCHPSDGVLWTKECLPYTYRVPRFMSKIESWSSRLARLKEERDKQHKGALLGGASEAPQADEAPHKGGAHNAAMCLPEGLADRVLEACAQGDGQVVILLLSRYPIDTAVTEDGDTALIIASALGHEGVVRALLDNGADAMTTNGADELALHYAALAGHVEVAELLLGAAGGSDGVLVHDVDGNTPLHAASWRDHGDVVRCLLRAGSAVNDLNCKGMSPLHLASMAYGRGGTESLETVGELLEAGAQIDLTDAETCTTPLHIAASKSGELLLLMLKHVGFRPSTCSSDLAPFDNSGNSVLHIAAYCANCDTIRVLLDYQEVWPFVGIDAKNGMGDTPLHIAVAAGCLQSTTLLAEGGASLAETDVRGQTPLHVACLASHNPVIAYLLEKGAPADVPDIDGDTPLHNASIRGNTEAVRMLIEAGARADARNNELEDVMHYARLSFCASVQAFLEERIANTSVSVHNTSGSNPPSDVSEASSPVLPEPQLPLVVLVPEIRDQSPML
eukprot:m51a1_g14712 putative ankyrin unc44 (830) ;mRNA; f:160201-163850